MFFVAGPVSNITALGISNVSLGKVPETMNAINFQYELSVVGSVSCPRSKLTGVP